MKTIILIAMLLGLTFAAPMTVFNSLAMQLDLIELEQQSSFCTDALKFLQTSQPRGSEARVSSYRFENRVFTLKERAQTTIPSDSWTTPWKERQGYQYRFFSDNREKNTVFTIFFKEIGSSRTNAMVCLGSNPV